MLAFILCTRMCVWTPDKLVLSGQYKTLIGINCKSCFRLFWAAFIIFITQFACIIMYNLYNRFESAPTRIMIENPNENLKGLPLPAITLCTPNQLTLSALKHFEKTLVYVIYTFTEKTPNFLVNTKTCLAVAVFA